MQQVYEPEHDRRLEVVENDDTGGLNLYELDDEDERKWQIAHLDVETFESRVEDERYERLPEEDE